MPHARNIGLACDAFGGKPTYQHSDMMKGKLTSYHVKTENQKNPVDAGILKYRVTNVPFLTRRVYKLILLVGHECIKITEYNNYAFMIL